LLFNEYGCSKHKLIVGVAFFGHSFVLKNALYNKPGDLIDQAATINLAGGGYLTYSEICQKLQEGNWTRVFDPVVQGPYATKGDLWIGYDDVESIGVKIDWLKNNSFGGVMTWAIEEDDHKGLCGSKSPLITLMHDRLKDYVVVAP
jgi:chitinase